MKITTNMQIYLTFILLTLVCTFFLVLTGKLIYFFLQIFFGILSLYFLVKDFRELLKHG